MIVNAFQCTVCGDILYSRCEKDIQECACGRTTVSGNPETPTVTINGVDLVCPDYKEITLPTADKMTLWWDWDLRTDNYGSISDFHTQTFTIDK